jgi:hypothetical protein
MVLFYKTASQYGCKVRSLKNVRTFFDGTLEKNWILTPHISLNQAHFQNKLLPMYE